MMITHVFGQDAESRALLEGALDAMKASALAAFDAGQSLSFYVAADARLVKDENAMTVDYIYAGWFKGIGTSGFFPKEKKDGGCREVVSVD